ncbi:hypothetical protein [Shewanella baltica]|uniref:hypothetical protein n=1 Tax=Shewanella baltica TaxID=62322 RepID=UPI000D1B3944|nr:hypothetical protein [Shewanella baltica]AVT49761.1 hypothetical protein C8I07_19625 [Shewanella baltica]
MVYKLTEEDLAVFMPDPNHVTMDQVYSLVHHILPNSGNYAGFCASYTQPDDEYILYLDERENDKYLYIGGCLVNRVSSPTLVQPFLNFKNYYRPELNPKDWYMKGSGEWLIKGSKFAESKDEAFTKWILWTKFLKILKTPYAFHSITIDKIKFSHKEKSNKNKNIELYREAYLALLKTLEIQRYSKISIVTDNIEGAQFKGYLEAVEQSDSILENKIIGKSPVSKSDFFSEHSCWLQFVDMQIYALSRFIYPSGHNVLMNFEKYAYDLGINNWKAPETHEDLLELKVKESSYFILKDLYHHLRLRSKKNIHSPNYQSPISTMVLITNKEYLNFAEDVDKAIHEFCNRNVAKEKITFSIDRY